jgi:hypothetical protein
MKRLDEKAESAALEHLLMCAHCREKLDEAEDFIATLRGAGESNDRIQRALNELKSRRN